MRRMREVEEEEEDFLSSGSDLERMREGGSMERRGEGEGGSRRNLASIRRMREMKEEEE